MGSPKLIGAVLVVVWAAFLLGPSVGEYAPESPTGSGNVIIDMMKEFAKRLNKTNCWMCQHMPPGSTFPQIGVAPLKTKDYVTHGWGSRVNQTHDDACTGMAASAVPDSGIELADNYREITRRVSEDHIVRLAPQTTWQKDYKLWQVVGRSTTHGPFGACCGTTHLTAIFRPSNCSRIEQESGRKCTFTNNTQNMLKCSVGLRESEWSLRDIVVSVSCTSHNCSKEWPVTDRYRTLAVYGKEEVQLSMPVAEMVGTPYCFCRNATCEPQRNGSVCTKGATQGSHGGSENASVPLPEDMVMVCKGRAYFQIPGQGQWEEQKAQTCYLGRAVPLMRQPTSKELAVLVQCKPRFSRKKRATTHWQRFMGIVIPGYGVYSSQQELKALNQVLERHMNVSLKAAVAMQGELSEVRTMALQNRMALDIVLAEKGGTCTLIGAECCTYISDATQAVQDLKADTEKGVKELHEVHGWNPFGFMEGWMPSWGGAIMKGLIPIIVAGILFCLGMMCVCGCLKLMWVKMLKFVAGENDKNVERMMLLREGQEVDDESNEHEEVDV